MSNYRLQPNALWLNDGNGGLNDVAAQRGVTAASPGFGGGHSIGSAWGDCDNDGDLDLYFTTVYGTASFGRKNYPVLFANDGQLSMKDVTAASGLSGLPPTYQAAWADYDNDGDLDLVSAGRLFENQGNGNNWLKVRLEGDGVHVNRSAVGAQARIRLGERCLTRQVEAGTGEGNQNELTLHFGLGAETGPLRLEILWPNGDQQAVDGLDVRRLATIRFEP